MRTTGKFSLGGGVKSILKNEMDKQIKDKKGGDTGVCLPAKSRALPAVEFCW